MSRYNASTFLTGLLIGSLAGVAIALAYAPHEGAAVRGWRSRRTRHEQDSMVDEAGDESFPASDPPSFTAVSSSTV